MSPDVDSFASEVTPRSNTLNTYTHNEDFEDMEHPSLPGFFKDAMLYKQALDERFPYAEGSHAAAQSVQSFVSLFQGRMRSSSRADGNALMKS